MSFELVIPDHLSRSQLDTYSDCGMKWLLQRGMKVPQLPAWALIGGSAVHAVTEEFDRHLLEGNMMDDGLIREAFALDLESRTKAEEELYQVHRSQFRASGRASKQWPDKETEAWWKEKGPEFVLAWKSWRRVTPWDLVEIVNPKTGEIIDPIEYSFKLELADGLQTWGAIDRLFTYQGQLIVVDLKTGAYEPKKPDQLGDYSSAIEAATGIRPAWGYFWMARSGGTTDGFNLNRPRLMLPAMAKTYGTAQRGIEAGIFLANVSNLCSSCPVREFCSAVDGPRSSEIEV